MTSRNGTGFPAVEDAARSALAPLVANGAVIYDRQRHLPRLFSISEIEIADQSRKGTRAILARIARALRSERNRGRAGHWTYDLNRHIALAQAYAAERRNLAATRSS
jgi:hypothetical protein